MDSGWYTSALSAHMHVFVCSHLMMFSPCFPAKQMQLTAYTKLLLWCTMPLECYLMLGLSLPDTPGDATETQDAIFFLKTISPSFEYVIKY